MPLISKKNHKQPEGKSIFEEQEERRRMVSEKPIRPAGGFNFGILILSLVLLVLGILAIDYSQKYFAKRKAEEAVRSISPSPTPFEILAVEPTKTEKEKTERETVSGSVFKWIKKQKTEDGGYNLSVICTNKNQCKVPSKDGRIGLTALWAYFLHYKTYQDPQDLSGINDILNFYTYSGEYKTPFYFQNVFWNCKWVKEIIEAGFLTKEQKTMAENMCISKNTSNYPPLKKFNGKLSEDQKIDFLKIVKERPSVSQKYTQVATDSADYGDTFIRLSAFASDYAYRYLLDKKEVLLELAKGYFYEAVDYWNKQPAGQYLYGKCILGIAGIDLYKVTKDNKYLDFSKQFIEKEKIRDVCFYDGKSPVYSGYCSDSAFEKSSCAIFASDLYRLTKDEKYYQIKEDLLSGLMLLNFDGSGSKRQVNNFGAFYSKSGEDNYVYELRDNVLSLEALTRE